MLKKVGAAQFPFMNPVPTSFVCTPMDSGLDPLEPGTSAAFVKPVALAYREFLVRHILHSAHALCFFFYPVVFLGFLFFFVFVSLRLVLVCLALTMSSSIDVRGSVVN